MTIITKPITEKKFDKTAASLEEVEIIGAVPKEGRVDVESPITDGSQFVVLRARARRVSSATTLCLFLTALVVMSIGIIGGVYLYRQYARAQLHRFRVSCNIPNTQAAQELVELDWGEDNYEKIDVPDFQGGRKGRFIHDFNSNKTGIIDMDNKRCFVMPLNREMVLPPKSLFDLIQKMWGGYYEVDTETVRETMRVVTPPITDMKDMGTYINRECQDMTVYKLEKFVPSVYKRSVDIPENNFMVFAGKRTLLLNIVNFDEIDGTPV